MVLHKKKGKNIVFYFTYTHLFEEALAADFSVIIFVRNRSIIFLRTVPFPTRSLISRSRDPYI